MAKKKKVRMQTPVYKPKVPAKVMYSDRGSHVKAMVKLAIHFTAKHTETPGARMDDGKTSGVMI